LRIRLIEEDLFELGVVDIQNREERRALASASLQPQRLDARIGARLDQPRDKFGHHILAVPHDLQPGDLRPDGPFRHLSAEFDRRLLRDCFVVQPGQGEHRAPHLGRLVPKPVAALRLD
jgi:hypothetical protein